MRNDEMSIGEVDSIQFAIYLQKRAKERKIDVNDTKLQKLLYFCYGIYYANRKKVLLNECPKAWPYGPVFPRVYKKQLKVKKQSQDLSLLYDDLDDKTLERFKAYDSLIDYVLNKVGDWTAGQLSTFTHQEGSAWDKAIKGLGELEFAWNKQLDNEEIAKDFL